MENAKKVSTFIRHFPNILSFIRLVIAIGLSVASFLFKRDASGNLDRTVYAVSVVLLVIAIVTDFFDGKISRRYKVTSDFGALLDHLGDIVLVFAIVVFAFVAMQLHVPMSDTQLTVSIWVIAGLFLLKIAEILLPLVLFPGSGAGPLHTYLNKAAMGAIMFVFLFFIMYKEIVWWLLIVLEVFVFIAFAEELFLLFYDKVYDVNRKGLLFDQPKFKPYTLEMQQAYAKKYKNTDTEEKQENK